MSRPFAAFLILVVFASSAVAEPLRILTWNVESGGSSPARIAEQLGQFRDYHIVGLTEVGRQDFARYAAAVAGEDRASRRYIGGLSGGGNRLLIIYDTRRLQLVNYSELFRQGELQIVDDGWRHRAPLVCQLRDRITGTELLVTLVHLARGDANLRRDQAEALRLWAAAQTLPIVAIGDFSFDYSFVTQTGNDSFAELLKDGAWKWVKPDPLIDTNWADHDGDDSDDYPDSMLDFVFVSGGARDWDAECRVIVRPGDFPDDRITSDHRPVSCVMDVPRSRAAAESIESAVRRVLNDQAAAWNSANIDRFMQHYWKSDQLTFSSEGKTWRGWDATMERYRKRYPTPEKIGTLRFNELEVEPLGPTAALVLGRWHLTRRGEALEGNFSLVFRQVDGRWLIVHDHTSPLRDEK